jgi:uncharacterized protein YjbJ (UPF0337 family)
MHWYQIEGQWKQSQRRAKERWLNLSDIDLEMVGGRREVLVDKLQERYGIGKEEAERQVAEFEKTFADRVQGALLAD